MAARHRGPLSLAPAAEAQGPTIGAPGTHAGPANIASAPAADSGPPHSEKATDTGTAHGSRQRKRPWKRDWTTWVLILAPLVFITAVSITPIGNAAAGFGAVLGLGSLMAIPAALITKLIRRLRRRSRAR